MITELTCAGRWGLFDGLAGQRLLSPECRLCGHRTLMSILDLGATPPCELFLSAELLDLPENTYPLHLRLCPQCLLLQIPALITPEETFTEYAYFSSFSESWVAHAKSFVASAVKRLDLGPTSFVVEVASNDGYLLQHLVAAGVPCLGIEPSENVSAAARERGVPTRTAFLTESLAAEIVDERGVAALVVANNVYAHIPDLLGFTRALRRLVADDGYVSIEVHHARQLVIEGQFDTIYHEHFQYYTVLSASRALATAKLVVTEVEELSTHGGSIRLWARPETADPTVGASVEAAMASERATGLDQPEGYLGLAQDVARIRDDLVAFLIECRRAGLRVAGYGAPGKGNTLLNYCGIRPDLVAYLVDRNPYKHGRFTPGTRIPIQAVEKLAADRPDVIVVLPWNLRTEITAQLQSQIDWPTRLVFPLPHLEVVELTGVRSPG